MKRFVAGATLVALAVVVTGCAFFPDHADSGLMLYESLEGGFQMNVPVKWQSHDLDSLLSGVRFTTSAPGGTSMSMWVLFGPASGRTASEIIDDAESLRALVAESETTLSAWTQDSAGAHTIDRMTARKAAYTATLSGWDILGLAWATTDGDHDYVILAEASSTVYYDFENDFNDAVASFNRI